MVTVVFTPTYQIYLSRRCAFACDYCNFPNVPSPLPPSPKNFRAFLRTAQRMAAWQVTLTSGEGIDRLPEVESSMRYYGFPGWYDYIHELCHLTLGAKGRQPLTPVLDIGSIPTRELRRLAPVAPVIRLLLETADPALTKIVHAQAPHKNPLLRTLALNDVGRAGIPLITGIRVGIGETPDSWKQAADVVNEVHERHGNVMAFHIVPFVPQSFSRLANSPPVPTDVFNHAIRAIRHNLSSEITLVAEVYHRLALAPEAVVSGAFDFGPICIADNERFDVDMLNAVTGVSDLLGRIHIDVKCVPTIRENFAASHRLPALVASNLKRFQTISKPDCMSADTPAGGSPIPAL